MIFQTNISMASCTAEEKMESKGCDTPGLGSSLNGEKFDGLGSRLNQFTVDGKSTLINGKDVKPLEWTSKDTAIQASTIALIPLLMPLLGPFAILAVVLINNGRYSSKMEKIEESKKLDFFNENVRDQFDKVMENEYQSNQVEFQNQASELTSLYGTEWRISDLEEQKGSTFLIGEEKAEFISKIDAEIQSLKNNPEIGKIAELQSQLPEPRNDKENSTPIEKEYERLCAKAKDTESKYEKLKDHLPIMKMACEEIKDASTQNGIPSLEVLNIFNEHSSNRDAFKDIKGAEGYMSYLSDTYAQSGFSESNINNIFADTDSVYNISNMDVAESYINIMEIMPTDCNPREVFSHAMVHAAENANSDLQNLKLEDTPFSDMSKVFNDRFADGEQKMASIVAKIDNQTIKNQGKDSQHKNSSDDISNSELQREQQRQIEEQNQHQTNMA